MSLAWRTVGKEGICGSFMEDISPSWERRCICTTKEQMLEKISPFVNPIYENIRGERKENAKRSFSYILFYELSRT